MSALKNFRISLYQQAAQQGDAESQYQLGGIFEPEFPSNQEAWCKAIDLYQSAASQHHAKAQLKLGDCFFSGSGVSEDKAEAARFWRKAAEQGEKQAQLKLGLALWFGQGIGEDKQAALEWFQKSAEQGDKQSQVRLGAYNGQAKEQYELAEIIIDRCLSNCDFFEIFFEDEKTAKYWYLASADQGHADAQFKLGLLHEILEINEKDSDDWLRKAADQGHSDAHCFLGAMKGDAESQFKWGQKIDHKYQYSEFGSSADWYLKAADQGHVKAMLECGEMIYMDRVFPEHSGDEDWKNWTTGWYRRAASLGSAEAMNRLGFFYEEGNVIEMGGELAQDFNEALKWYRKAAELGHKYAMYKLGCLHLGSEYDEESQIPQDYTEAFLWFKKAAELGDANSMSAVGRIYKDGKGVPQDYDIAFQWSRKAAKLRSVNAFSDLAYFYRWGKGVPADLEEAKKWAILSDAYDDDNNDNETAQFALGMCYLEGRYVSKNEAEALEWLHKSAQKGFAPAQWMLGNLYTDGVGVPQDDYESFNWNFKAAIQGFPPAQNSLGCALDEGRGIFKNNSEAFEWFKKAADSNDKYGQLNTGVYYKDGLGVSQNLIEAFAYLSLARIQLPDEVKSDLSKVENLLLKANQLEKAKTRTMDLWKLLMEEDDKQKNSFKFASITLLISYGFDYSIVGIDEISRSTYQIYKRATSHSAAFDQYRLGKYLLVGQGIPQDKREALDWLSKAANQDYPDAINTLGCCYYYGYGVPIDKKEAEAWFRKGAIKNHTESLFNLGICLFYEKSTTGDLSEAINLWEMAVKFGPDHITRKLVDALSQKNAALEWKEIYESTKGEIESDLEPDEIGQSIHAKLGRLVSRNLVKRLEKKYQACDTIRTALGDPKSEFFLGFCYQFGIGVQSNEEEALKWYRQAADHGDAHAQNALGVYYIKTQPNDSPQYIDWFEKAANQGLDVGQYNLSICLILQEPLNQEKAITLLEEIINIDTNDEIIHFEMHLWLIEYSENLILRYLLNDIYFKSRIQDNSKLEDLFRKTDAIFLKKANLL